MNLNELVLSQRAKTVTEYLPAVFDTVSPKVCKVWPGARDMLMKTEHTSIFRNYSNSTAIRLIFVAALALFTASPTACAQPQSGNSQKSASPPREQAIQTLFEQGQAAADQEDLKTALATFEQVAQQFGKGDPPAVRVLVAKALLNKGGILSEQGDTKAAIITYERIDRRFGKDEYPAIRGVIASALASKAEALYKQGNTKASIATYEQLRQRFSKDKDVLVQQLVGLTQWRTAEILADTTP
jgi:tetratricopeptide (TPR) repeat protein